MICQTCRTALRAQRLTALRLSTPLTLPPRPSNPPKNLLPTRSFSSSSFARSSSSSNPKNQNEAQPLEQNPAMSPAESHIANILSSQLQPTRLLVQDISGGCGSMYAIDISSPLFRGLSILKQQRMVNASLGDLVKQWHGVQIRTEVSP